MTRALLPTGDDWHVGTFVKTTSPQCVEILGGTGLDFAVLDAEHAPFDRAALDLALMAGRSCGLPLFVRVLERTAAGLLSVLDMGAAGVLVPHVDTVTDAREVVAHCRYVGGDRGYSSSPRAAGYGALGMKEAIRQGDRSVVLAQIESVEAVRNAAGIAAVEGVAGLFIGRADLALSMGLDSAQAPEVAEATEQVIRAGLAAGKLVGMFVGSQAERERYRALGVRWFIHGSDQGLLRQAAQAIARPAAPTSSSPSKVNA
jgi:2-keto-3-deoxy-L-rhamnonate aldolase RhmA